MELHFRITESWGLEKIFGALHGGMTVRPGHCEMEVSWSLCFSLDAKSHIQANLQHLVCAARMDRPWQKMFEGVGDCADKPASSTTVDKMAMDMDEGKS